MTKEWKCKDCVCFGTDACHYPSMLEEYVACEHLVVDHDKAYQQGREDYETECKKRYCCYAGKDCIIGNLVEEDAYQQGRADAIDEFVKKVIDCGMTDGYVDADLFMEIAEQIKEQKNE